MCSCLLTWPCFPTGVAAVPRSQNQESSRPCWTPRPTDPLATSENRTIALFYDDCVELSMGTCTINISWDHSHEQCFCIPVPDFYLVAAWPLMPEKHFNILINKSLNQKTLYWCHLYWCHCGTNVIDIQNSHDVFWCTLFEWFSLFGRVWSVHIIK